MSTNFKIEITSVPDRDNLVAEIWCDELLVAEINQESRDLEIEFYLSEHVSFNFDEFLGVLEMAKGKLQDS